LTCDLRPRLSVGVEYNPKSRSGAPLANLRLVDEGARRPAVILGTSSDRIGTPSGQSFYATVSKDLERETGLPLAPYVGVAYGTHEDEARVIAGASVRLARGLSSLVIFDGVHVHPTFGYASARYGVSLLLVRGRHPGLSVNLRF
jgi:hypothetical protein